MRGVIRLLHLTFLLALLALLAVGALATQVGRNYAAKLERYIDRLEHRYLFMRGKPLNGTPDLSRYEARLKTAGVREGAPVFIRIFKQESELELWLHDGRKFVLFATYPTCYWSGSLGPKLKEGDGQSPEGFYTVSKSQLNPNSRWHRSFNLGFPNAFDQSHGRTGSFLMVHGGCASIGCYAMTDLVIDEIWRLVTAALNNGQARFSVHAFPFRMTRANLDWYTSRRRDPFWSDLKKGYDVFERTHVPPQVTVCDGRYRAAAGKKGSIGSAQLTKDCSATASAR